MTDTKRTPYPIGPSLVKVAWADLGTSSRKGTPYVAFKLEGMAGDAKGMTIRHTCYLSEKALWALEDFALCIGADAANMVSWAKSGDVTNIIASSLDKSLKLVVKADNYTDSEGIEREGRKVVAIESLDPAVKSYMEKRRRARMTGGKLPAQIPTAPTNTSTDDELPF